MFINDYIYYCYSCFWRYPIIKCFFAISCRLPLVVLPATYRNQVLSGCVPLAVCAAYALHRRVAMRAVSRSFPAKDLGKGAATRSWNEGVKNLEAVGNVEISRPFHLSILSITHCLPIINPISI